MKKAKEFLSALEEQKHVYEVDLGFSIQGIVRTPAIKVFALIGGEDLGAEGVHIIHLTPHKVAFTGRKTIEVYDAAGPDEARRRFEKLSAKDVDLDLYVGEDYLTSGFETEIESFEVKIHEVRQIE